MTASGPRPGIGQATSRERRAHAPVPGSVELAARLRRHHAASSPALATALCLGAWATALLIGGPLHPGNAIQLWAGAVTVLAVIHVVVARLDVAPSPPSPLVPATLLVTAVVLGAGMAMVPVAPGAADGRLLALVAVGVAAAAAAMLVLRPELLLATVAVLVLPLVFARLQGASRDAPAAVVMLGAAGMLAFGGLRLGAVFGRTLRNDAEQRALLRRLEETNQALSADRVALQTESRTDPLTRLANRRYLEETLQAEWNRCRRSGAPLSCVMLDIDHFKAYNDHYGHDGGDTCLRRIAAVLSDCTRRAGDVVARYGGEEFVVLLPETGVDGATTVASLLKRAVAEAAIPHATTPLGAVVTVSQGVATLVPDEARVPAELLKAADLALYEAKRAGRNRVVMADADTLESARMAARGLIG